MKYSEHLSQMKEIQHILINFFDNDCKKENNISNIILFFNDLKNKQNIRQLKELLHLLLQIANNHHRSSCFFKLYEEIFKLLKNDIMQNFTNNQIFTMFFSNKRILLILFEEKILTLDDFIIKTFQQIKYYTKSYLSYFYPEIKNSLSQKELNEINDQISNRVNGSYLLINPEKIEKDLESFELNRKNGENEKYICKLIQNDAIDEFISYVNQSNYALSSIITPSIFETNPFLLENETISLIEYCAFYGSNQIFKYLIVNNVKPTPSLWLYSIHGNNSELINFLEENKIKPIDNSFIECIIEAIKCHHNDIASYIQTNLLNTAKNTDFSFLSICRKYFNYYFFPDELEMNSNIFFDFCEFDYVSIIELILESNSADITNFKTQIKEDKNIEIKKSALYVAVENRNIEIVKLLLNKNVFDINERSEEKLEGHINQKTPLAIAVINEDIDMAQLLISQPNIDIDLPSFCTILYSDRSTEKEDSSPLHFAIINNDVKMAELLIFKSNANVNMKTIEKYTSIMNQNISEKTPLYLAVEKNNIEIVQMLIARKDTVINMLSTQYSSHDYSYLETTALHVAVLLNRLDIVRLLFSREDIDLNCNFKFKKLGDDEINEKGALFLAVEMQLKEMVSLLLSNKNIDVNLVNITKFKEENGSFEKNTLYMAVEKGDPDIVKLLLMRNEININYRSIYISNQKSLSWNEYREKTPLHMAVDRENINVIAILLEQENLNVNDIFLTRRKTSTNALKIEEKTALHLAIEKNCPDAVRLLLTRNDIQINLKYHFTVKYFYGFFTSTNIKKTALHIAVEKDSLEIIRLLLAFDGIDKSSVNESGKKPIDITQNSKIIELLKK